MRQCDATMLALGLPARWVPGADGGVFMLDVALSDSEQVVSLLSALQQEDRNAHLARLARRPASATPLWLQPPFAVAIGMAATTLAFFGVTGPNGAGNPFFSSGALIEAPTLAGQWWRLITAATLHADAGHALSNAGFFVVLGWGASERLGAGVAVLVWLLTAIAGFGASLVFTDTISTVGASGGLYGLLGAAAGLAERRVLRGDGLLGKRWKGIGAGILFVAFTGFGSQVNIAAHLGGAVAGLALGLLAPRRPPGAALQIVAAGATAGAVAVAWFLAMGPRLD